MRLGFVLLFCLAAFGQIRERDFSGSWTLDAKQSEVRTRFDLPVERLVVREQPSLMSVEEGGATIVYPIGAGPKKTLADGLTFNVATKWEGDALLANIIVSGEGDYSLFERWSKSRDGGILTITRTLEGRGADVESRLVYRNSAAAPAPAPVPIPASDYVLAPGTRILLRLTSSLNTKHTKPGDRVYLETAAPVFLSGRLVVPKGSYVTGTVTEAKESGRVKGRAALNIRFDTLTLPNGVARDFRSRISNADGQGNLDPSEGRITADGTKGRDSATVARTAGAGAGIGTLAGAAAGHVGEGLGIGSAAGAVAGLAGVFGSRGREVALPAGTTMEMVLDRELRFTQEEIGRIR
ncbi:MAG: TrbI/VirB10 family protein [Acidobacteriota bacterium]|nr:TrbI/VirB10 family protein [Acidobacteriota bacterium]